MPKSTIETSISTALIINPQTVGSSEMVRKLHSMGIQTKEGSDSDTNFQNIESFSYVIWYTENIDKSINKIETALENGRYFPKTLFIFGLDKTTETIQTANDWLKQQSDSLNQITRLSKHYNIDARIICHRGLWSIKDGNASELLSTMSAKSAKNQLRFPSNTMMYPLEINDLIIPLFNVWFDRGHRGKIIEFHGKPIEINLLKTAFNSELNPNDIQSNQDSFWLSEEGIDGGEIIELPSKVEDLILFLKSKYVDVAPLPLEVITPAPIRIVKKIIPKINPIPAPTPVLPPPIPVKSIKKETKHFNWHLPLGILCSIVGLIILPLALAFWVIFGPHSNSVNTILEVYEQKQQQLDLANSYTNFILSSMKIVPFTQNFIQKVIDSQSQAKERLMVLKAQAELVTAIRRMATTTAGDPFTSLQQAKYLLDEIYVYQTIHRLEKSPYRMWVINTRQAVTLMKELIPANKKITVMLLLQNNLELRPTGGFIGAVALLTFDHAKLLTIETRDIYDLDSNLKGIVNPPNEIKSYLGESSWFFRDSNWSPDFVETSGTANWFLEKEWGNPADIVIGINLNTIKTILQSAGPITLPDGQIVSSENVLVSAFNHQDVPTNKPDGKKQEFLSLFIKPLIDQLSVGTNIQVLNVINAASIAMAHNELFITATDKSNLSELIERGWSGQIVSPKCPTTFASSCFADSLFVNEANVGINKSNYYVTRTINHTITLAQDSANHTHSIDFTNKSPSDTWPGGNYKSYVRLYVPKDSNGINVTINGATITPSISTSTTSTSFHQVVGLYLEVKPQTTTNLSINYTVPQPSAFQTYIFLMQKQAGVSADPYSLKLTTAPGMIISKSQPETDQPSTIVTSGNFDQNASVSVELKQ